MDTYMKQAFELACKGAKARKSRYVSLYANVPFYGGPEEGGWWGNDTELVASREYPTKDMADEALKAVEVLANEMSDESRKGFGKRCLDEMEWLEARGLEADFLPEPDGQTRYWVCIEKQAGSREHRGSRGYS